MIEYKEKIIPEAFHGTSIDNAENIIANGFIIKNRIDPYLGNGVYFYEACREHAIDYVENRYHLSHAEIAVICARIDLGRCLELNNSKHVEWLKLTWKLLSEQGIDPITDAVVINFFIETFSENVDTVRASQLYSSSNRQKIFTGSRFFSSQRIVICVRNLKSIQDCTLCNMGDKDNE